ncbi:hypothetical protein ACFX13_011823 [Malus domestica]
MNLFLIEMSLAASSSPCKYPAIFNFGDSNSDTGGLSAVFGQVRLPPGESYFHRPAACRLLLQMTGSLYCILAHILIMWEATSHTEPTLPQRAQPSRAGIVPSPWTWSFKQLMPKADDFSRALYTFDIGRMI